MDKYDEQAAELLPCNHGSWCGTDGIQRCSNHLLRPAVVAALRDVAARERAEGYVAGVKDTSALTAKFIDLCEETGSKGVAQTLYQDLLLPQIALKKEKS